HQRLAHPRGRAEVPLALGAPSRRPPRTVRSRVVTRTRRSLAPLQRSPSHPGTSSGAMPTSSWACAGRMNPRMPTKTWAWHPESSTMCGGIMSECLVLLYPLQSQLCLQAWPQLTPAVVIEPRRLVASQPARAEAAPDLPPVDPEVLLDGAGQQPAQL